MKGTVTQRQSKDRCLFPPSRLRWEHPFEVVYDQGPDSSTRHFSFRDKYRRKKQNGGRPISADHVRTGESDDVVGVHSKPTPIRSENFEEHRE